MNRVKFGFHYLNDGNDTTGDLINRVPMTVVKFAGIDLDWLRDGSKIALLNAAKASGALVVGRRGTGNDGPNLDLGQFDMVNETRAWYIGARDGNNNFDQLIAAFPQVDVWEGPNEIAIDVGQPNSVQRIKNYANCMVEFARLLKVQGKLGALGNWATGGPDISYWQYWEPVLKTCKENGHYLSRHGYGPHVGSLGLDQTLRYRRDNIVFTAMGYPDVRVILTEFGADKIFDYPGTFRDVFGKKDEAAGNYWDQYLLPIVNEFEKDPYMVGGTLFTVGNGGSWAWNGFDAAHTDIASHILANPPVAPVLPSNPVPVGATHVVTALALNVREFPWLGTVTPPVTGLLKGGDFVCVWGKVQLPNMSYPWCLVGPDGNRWVSGYYLKAV